MAEEKQPPSFKVVDRRSFTTDGSRREPDPAAEGKASSAKNSASAIAEAGVGAVANGPATGERAVAAGTATDAAKPGNPPIPTVANFQTLVSYLATTAMFQLGLLAGPSGETIPLDLANARRTVDLLGVLQEKTQGNLTPEEARMLDDVLYELRLSFLEIQKRGPQASK
jgi:hypothetical protein